VVYQRASAPDTRGRRSGVRLIDSAHRALGSSSVGGYVNYLERGRPVASYYGGNLRRLRRVKDRHDPDGFFRSAYTV
jgi:hypothetical protein